MRRFRFLTATTFALAVACVTDTLTSAAPEGYPYAAERVVVISVDGLRGDAVDLMPTLAALRARAAWTDSMRTVVPSVTLPGHLAMLTGRDVTELGISSNDIDAGTAAVLRINGITTVFEWVRAAGGSTRGVVGATLVPESQRGQAQTFFGLDSLRVVGGTTAEIIDAGLAALGEPEPPTVLFLHLADVDLAGHAAGWIDETRSTPDHDVITDRYRAAVLGADSAIAQIWNAIASEVTVGRIALVVTADHGGGHGVGCVESVPASREHCTSHPADARIPFVLVAKQTAGTRIERPTSVTQVGPTVGAILRIAIPSRAGRAVEF